MIKNKLEKNIICVMLAVTVIISTIMCDSDYIYASTSVSGVDKIAGLSDDFYRGADISSVLALENSGVEYKYLMEQKQIYLIFYQGQE